MQSEGEEGAIGVVVNAARKTASCFLSLFLPSFLSISAKPDLEAPSTRSRRRARRSVGRIFALLRLAPLALGLPGLLGACLRGRGEAEAPLGFIALALLSRSL